MVDKVKATSKNSFEFIKRLLAVFMAILAMLPVASAIYSVVYTRSHISGFAVYALIFSSVVGGCLGLIALYGLLMKQEAK